MEDPREVRGADRRADRLPQCDRGRLRRWALLPLILSAAPASGQETSAPPIPALLEPAFLLSTARIVEPEDFTGDGGILGATREIAIRDQSLTSSDQVFVPRSLRGRVVELGEMIQFYQIDRRIDDPLTSERLGRLLLPTGIGRVDSLAGEVARVRVTHAFRPILIDDFARAVVATDTVPLRETPGIGVAEGYVVALVEEKAIVPPFDRLFVRMTEAGALIPGDVVLIHRPGAVESGRRLPEVHIGRAMVVRVEGEIAAVVLFEVVRSDLVPGDRFRRVPAR